MSNHPSDTNVYGTSLQQELF